MISALATRKRPKRLAFQCRHIYVLGIRHFYRKALGSSVCATTAIFPRVGIALLSRSTVNTGTEARVVVFAAQRRECLGLHAVPCKKRRCVVIDKLRDEDLEKGKGTE